MSRNDGILTHFIVKGCQKERWHDFTMISHYSTICYYHFFVHLQRIKKRRMRKQNIRLLIIILYWVCSQSWIFAQTSHRLVTHFGESEGLQSSGVNCLSYDSKGFIWIGSISGLTRFDGAHFRTFPMPIGGQGSFIYSPRAMAFDHNDKLWIGTKRGLYSFDTTTETFQRFDSKNLTDSTYVRFVGVDAEGKVWVQTDTQCFCIESSAESCVEVKSHKTVDALREWNNKQTQQIKDLLRNTGLNNVTACLQDNEGGWWIGTYFDGLFYIHPEVALFSTINDGANERKLLIVREITPWKNQVYVGTENAGLRQIDKKEDGTSYLKRIPLFWQGRQLSENVQAVASIDGKLWLGMAWEGIYIFDPLRGRLIKHYTSSDVSSGLLSNNIVCLYQTQSGDVMIGTKKGLFVLPKGKNNFEQVEGLKSGMVHALAESEDGTMWVGYLEESMQCLQRGTDGVWKTTNAGFSHECVTALLNAPDGSLWIGTDCKGVWKMTDKGTFKPTSLTYDVLRSSANTMIFDKEGMLWVSSNSGLFCYDVVQDKLQHFTTTIDGLPSDQMSFFSGYLASDGQIYMGTYKGLAVFQPSKLRQRPIMLRPYFTNVCIGQNDMLAMKEIVLEYNAPSLRIDYGVPIYSRRQNIWYRYRLEGASQEEWTIVQAGEQSIYVSHLAPGSYKLVLQASQEPNRWDDNMQTEMQIDVKPPFWLSAWGIFLYVFIASVICFLLLGVWRHRIERQNLCNQIAVLLRDQELMRNTQATSPYDLIKDIAKNKTDNHLMEQIDDFLERNYKNQQLQVEMMAEHLNISKSTLYRRMREVTSLSPNDYIRLFRLKKAAKMLREEGMSIRDVSDVLCFSSVSYFTNSFSQQFGVTPGEYVKQAK